MTAVKICGLTRPEDVTISCELGAAYVGFNFVASSPRRITAESVRQLAAATAPGVLKVGIFAHESPAVIAAAVDSGRLDLIQLHRRLTEEEVAAAPVPVIAVARLSEDSLGVPRQEILVRCHAILFDPSEGTGASLDPGRVAEASWPVPVIVAGGLNPDNVRAAIRRLRPAAVDVASGVESQPGIKDPDKLRRFFEAVKEADREAG